MLQAAEIVKGRQKQAQEFVSQIDHLSCTSLNQAISEMSRVCERAEHVNVKRDANSCAGATPDFGNVAREADVI